MAEWVEILASLGVVAALLAVAKHFLDRWRWRRFKKNLEVWTNLLLEVESLRPHNDDEWRAACETYLTQANFSPLEIRQLLDAALVVAKGIAADKFLLKEESRRHETDET